MVEDSETRGREEPWLHLGNSLRNASSPNLSQGTSTKSRSANSVTLWMPQMTICDKMWGLIPNSCLRSSTCMSWILCANLWWGFQLGPSGSLRKIGLLHYLRPSWRWKAFRMWGEVKNPGSRRTTRSFTRSHAMMENGIEGKKAQERKSPNNSKAWGSNPREISWRSGLFSKRTNPREMLGETHESMLQMQRSEALLQRLSQVQSREWGL